MTDGADGHRRLLGTVLAVCSIALWAVLTLEPSDSPLDVAFGWGRWSLADGLRNVALTAPLGVGLALRGRTIAGATGLTAGLAVAIEMAQWWVPGRYVNPLDVVANAVGAGLGVVVWRFVEAAPRLSLDSAGWHSLGAGLAFAGWVLLGAIALRPSFPDSVYDPAWTPDLHWLAPPHGTVLEAQIGDVTIPHTAPAEDSEAIRAVLVQGEPARVRWRFAEERSDPPAPLVRLNDSQSEIWLVAVAGRDLVWQWRVRARDWGLEQPAWRWPGALEAVRPGDVVTLDWEIDGTGLEARIDDGATWRSRISPGGTWRLFWPTRNGPERGRERPGLDWLWLALAWAPVGLYARRSTWTAVSFVLAAGSLCVAPWLGLAGPTWVSAASAATGLGIGAGLGRPHGRGRPGPDQNRV